MMQMLLLLLIMRLMMTMHTVSLLCSGMVHFGVCAWNLPAQSANRFLEPRHRPGNPPGSVNDIILIMMMMSIMMIVNFFC